MTYFNEEVCDFLKAHYINTLFVTPILRGQQSEPSFCLMTEDKMYFVKFSRFDRFSKTFLSDLEMISHKTGNRIILPFLTKNIISLNRQINVYCWIDGDNLRTILARASVSDYKKYGRLCGAFLRSIHQPLEQSKIRVDIARRFQTNISRIHAQRYEFIYTFDYEEFFFNNLCYLQSEEDPAFIHLDFKPKNIILNNGDLVLVDIDSSSVGDPWLDFYDKAFPLQANKEIFNSELIQSYFNSRVTNQFWYYFRALSVYALIQNIAWLLQRNQKQYLGILETYLWESYSGFTEIIPLWYKV